MKAAIIGYGKMGHEIERVLLDRGHEVVLIVDVENRADLTPERLQGVDVAIEFSTPATAVENIFRCFECGIPVVSGTTGWTARMEEVQQVCKAKNGGLFWASNYSIGVNLFFRVNRMLARMMNRFPQYDVTVEEVHHIQKKDAPSGTAITIAEGILQGLDRKTKWVGNTTTEPEELEVLAVRRGMVPGIHTVTWESEADSIELRHRAVSRRGFAEGAVLAAEFMVGRQGIYSMDDLLGAE